MDDQRKTPAPADTSDAIAAIAGRYLNMEPADLEQAVLNTPADVLKDLRAMAASLLRQNER